MYLGLYRKYVGNRPAMKASTELHFIIVYLQFERILNLFQGMAKKLALSTGQNVSNSNSNNNNSSGGGGGGRGGDGQSWSGRSGGAPATMEEFPSLPGAPSMMFFLCHKP